MYARFDTVSFTAIPNEGSEPVRCDSLSRPTSESPGEHESPAGPEEEEDNYSKVAGNGGGGQASQADEDDRQEEVSSNQAAEGRREQDQDDDHDHHGVDGGDDEDEGYHTPTSPRHRIPADLPCPPAPRKALPEPRRCKRKAGDRVFYRVVWRRSQLLPLGVELVHCPVTLGSRTTESTASLADMLVTNKENL